jgi:hypothetical protein
MVKVSLLQGEAKTLPFRIKDKITRRWLDLNNTSCLFIVKRSPEDDNPIFIKQDADFIKVGADRGYLSLFLTTQDTWQEPWTYDAEIRITGIGSPEPISKVRFDLDILQAIY